MFIDPDVEMSPELNAALNLYLVDYRMDRHFGRDSPTVEAFLSENNPDLLAEFTTEHLISIE